MNLTELLATKAALEAEIAKAKKLKLLPRCAAYKSSSPSLG